MKCNIYYSDSSSKSLSKPVKLKGGVNHPGHTYTQPFPVKVKTGKTEQNILYFASDLKGSSGGMDIWYTVIDNKGKAGKPVNCGKTVNTIRDEIAPYYDSETGALYFSSNFHNGFGGYDVFRALGSANKYNKPENLFKPVNSSLDDTYYTLNHKDKFKGFLVSNRPGGHTMLSETCCDDIYSIHYRQPTILVVNVTDSATGTTVNNVKISLKSSRYSIGTPDSIIFSTNPEAMDNQEIQTDPSLLQNLQLSKQPASFYVLESNNIIQLNTEATNYNSGSVYIKTDKNGLIENQQVKQGGIKKEGNQRFVVLNVALGKEKNLTEISPAKKDTVRIASSLKKEFESSQKNIKSERAKTEEVVENVKESKSVLAKEFSLVLHSVYDKVDIIDVDKVILDSIITILKSDPKIKIELTTHTDWIGSEEYNWKLSFRRADFLKNYLISKGIEQKRVSASGKGESRPIAPNAKPDGSDDPEGRQKNRRTDVRLIY